MVIYTLSTPLQVGTMQKPVTVKALQVTAVWWSSTPALAPLGTQELKVTLTGDSGWQETIGYRDATVGPFWTSSVTVNAQSLADVVATAVLNKLIADKKIPAGTIDIA